MLTGMLHVRWPNFKTTVTISLGATVRMIFLEIFREVDVRLENNACQIS